ncbi:hypothetical protein AM629_06280 [Photorhabdus heterorhabditis]|nr:hypothetical protein [Photorhabdus heterorhabditis]KOY62820.1 hypothetical protein AM629_06280 [Photorhabdus heterorhabditis]
MTNKFLVSISLLLTGCTSIDRINDTVPSIDYDLSLEAQTTANTNGKVAFFVESAGTDMFLLAGNGTKSFIELSNVTFAGSRCSYSTRKTQLIPPGTIMTFKAPTIGLIGLCYTNEDQMILISNPFRSITNKPKTSVTLPLYFSLDYIFPGQPEEKKKYKSINYLLNFDRRGV